MKHNNMFSKAHGGQFGVGSQPFNTTVNIPLVIGGTVAGVPVFTNIRIAVMDGGEAYVCDLYCVDGILIAAPKKGWLHLRGARRDKFDIICERIAPYHEHPWQHGNMVVMESCYLQGKNLLVRWAKMRDGMDDGKGGVRNASYMPFKAVYEAIHEQQEAMG